MLYFLKLIFGKKLVYKTTPHYVLVRYTRSGALYFRVFEKGVPEFTLYKAKAWKFQTPDDARTARINMGLMKQDMCIEENVNP